MSEQKMFEVDYDLAVSNNVCSTAVAWAQVPQEPAPVERERLITRIKELLKQHNALLVAHYYVHPDLQDLAEVTGGIVSDSLEMARFGRDHPAKTLIVAGVRFMGESAKILSPEKTVLVPDLRAECSLDLGCPIDEFAAFCDAHPDREVVVYANTSAEVKARADWMVTSSIALKIVAHLKEQGKKIIWAPDRHLGTYIQKQTGADMLLWQGSCIVHNEFKAIELENLKAKYPQAKVLVHPESPDSVVQLADVVGSTSAILNGPAQFPECDTFIVATDNGMLHQLRLKYPTHTFIEAPTAGESATCKSCAHCPWMAMNSLQGVVDVLEKIGTGYNEILIDPTISERAKLPIERMLNFAAADKTKAQQQEISKQEADFQPNIGPA